MKSGFGPWLAGSAAFMAVVAAASAQDRGQKIQDRGQKIVEVLGPSPELPRYHAMIIGINDYADNTHWPDLRRARQDAEKLAALLKAGYGFANPRLLTDAAATREGILEGLYRATEGLTERDALLVYFAGHGFYDRIRDNGFWIPVSGTPPDQGRPRADWIKDVEIKDILGKTDARHVLVISDACFGGALMRGGPDSLTKKDIEYYRLALRQPTRYCLTAGDLETVPDESVFSTKVIQSLQYPRQEVFCASDIAFWIRKDVAELTRCQIRFGSLRLAQSTDAGEFIFARTGSAPEEPAPVAEPRSERRPTLKEPWENSLGMKFAPVPGTEALFCVWETRCRDVRAFKAEQGGGWFDEEGLKGDLEPASNVSWEDAKAFCDWLTRKERAGDRISPDLSYRLPRDWEWSAAAGLNEPKEGAPKDKDLKTAASYPWGSAWPPPKGAGNYGSALKVDAYDSAAPVGSFPAGRNGLYDLGGNVWEWCEDWYDAGQKARVLRGGSWVDSSATYLLSSSRNTDTPGCRRAPNGFRVVLAPSP